MTPVLPHWPLFVSPVSPGSAQHKEPEAWGKVKLLGEVIPELLSRGKALIICQMDDKDIPGEGAVCRSHDMWLS